MKSYQITGNLCVRGIGDRDSGPFHLGASDELSAYIDRTVFRDSTGRPLLPGTSLTGVMAALARASLRAAGWTETDPLWRVFIALFGSARGDGEGQSSRLIVRDSRLSDAAVSLSLVRDRNGINRERGSADEKRLFHEEVIDGAWSFLLNLEFSETGPRTLEELKWQTDGFDPDSLSFRLLLDVLCLLEAGWANLGGKASIGYGRLRLEDCQIAERNRRSPEAVLAFARDRWKARDADGNLVFPPQRLQHFHQSTAPIDVNENRKERPQERIRFRCVLRPLEPLLVKTGYTIRICENIGSQKPRPQGLAQSWETVRQEFPIDSDFCVDARNKPYLPGSSIRGASRSHVERAVRTIVNNNGAAWNLKRAQEKGKEFSEHPPNGENEVECLVSHVFGFSALGGRILFSDAVPLEADRFEARRKLLDHVALDRFTCGAADKRKFNSLPYFPAGPPDELINNGRDDGDLVCEIELYDFEEWHLGMLLLLLRDLRLGRVVMGHGKNKGFGKVRLESVQMEALTAETRNPESGTGIEGVLAAALPTNAPSVAGFKTFTANLSFDARNYLDHETLDTLTSIFRGAEQKMRGEMAKWAARVV